MGQGLHHKRIANGVSSKPMSAFLCVLDRWQTLATGILALIGAGLTVWFIHRQIKQTAYMEKARLLREEQAAKAVLPLALAELAQYAEDCIRLIAPFIPPNGNPSALPTDFVVPRIPEGTIDPLRDCARYADPQIAEQIHTMLGKLQVQHGRLESIRQRTSQHHMRTLHYYEGIRAVIDAAELDALMIDLLLYARGTSVGLPMSFNERVRNQLIKAGLIDHAKLFAEVDRCFPPNNADHTG